MRFILIITIFFTVELKAQEDFGFVYSWEIVHSYNSFTETYTKSVCGQEKPYEIKLELKEKNLVEFKNKLEELKFWSTNSNIFSSHEDSEEASLLFPCQFQSLFVESGSNTNYIDLTCFSPSKSVELLREEYKKFFSEIEEKIITHSAFIKVQKLSSGCIIRE